MEFAFPLAQFQKDWATGSSATVAVPKPKGVGKGRGARAPATAATGGGAAKSKAAAGSRAGGGPRAGSRAANSGATGRNKSALAKEFDNQSGAECVAQQKFDVLSGRGLARCVLPKEFDKQSGARIGGRPGDQILNLMSCGAGEFDNQSGKQLIVSWVSRVYLYHMQSRLYHASEPGLRQPCGVPFLGCLLLTLQIPCFLSILQCFLCAACFSFARLVCHIPYFPASRRLRAALRVWI